MLAILGRSWASTGGPGPLLGPLCAVLGRSWSLCWRSWAALGAYVGGLGLLLGPKLAVLGRFRGLSGRSWSIKALQKALQTRNRPCKPAFDQKTGLGRYYGVYLKFDKKNDPHTAWEH